MKPDFYLKAISNPDMQDFCSYLEKPLDILEELQYRYRLLSVEEKVKHHNMIIYLKIDKMMNKYLPEMVNNFCEFSFKYRNEEIVKTEETKEGLKAYTAKEVLLQNLGKLIEEINVIESDFNQNNKFNLLVQKELLTNLGYVPEIQLDSSPSKKVVLENQFKYEPSIKLDIFKKPDFDNDKIFEEVISEKTDKGLSLIEVLLVLGFIGLSIVGTLAIYDKVRSQQQLLTEVEHVKLLKKGTQNLFSVQGNYTSLSNSVLNEGGVTPYEMRGDKDNKVIKDVWGNDINIKPVNLNNKDNQGFEIIYSNVDLKNCSELVSSLSTNFNEIKVNNKVVVKGANYSQLNDIKTCETISFTSE